MNSTTFLWKRALLSGAWDEIPGVYLPSKVLDLCLSVVEHPSDDIVRQLSLLSWTTPQEVRDYETKVHAQVDNQIKAQLERERWKSHHLYKTQTKPQLESQCRKLKIPVTSTLLKHQLVDLISQHQGETPPEPVNCLYSGRLSSVPLTTASIRNLTIPKLRSILKHHNIPPFGEKDQLVMKVFLLRQGQTAAITSREENQLKDLIQLAYQTIYNQRYLNVSSHVYRKRTYTLQTISPHFIPPPSHVQCESDLQSLFQPLIDFLDRRKQQREDKDDRTPILKNKTDDDTAPPSNENLAQRITQIGSKVKLHWSAEEVGDMGWRPGWYVATVQNYCQDTDMLTVTYSSEPDETYHEELLPLLSKGAIKLLWSPV